MPRACRNTPGIGTSGTGLLKSLEDREYEIERRLESDETAQKRAQWEQLGFDVNVPGLIKVTNEGHETPADHQYTVSIDDVTDDLMACTCPHYVHEDDSEPEKYDCDGLGGFPC